MVVFFGSYLLFKKKLGKYRKFNFCQFYEVKHIWFIPIFWQRKFGLFSSENKSEYLEFDYPLEKKLLRVSGNSKFKYYLDEIKKYEKEFNEKKIYYEKHKIDHDKKENKEFIKFLKNIGIIFGLLILFAIIKYFLN